MFKKTVASITADFAKKVEQLRALNQEKLDEAVKLEGQILDARKAQDEARAEAEKALKVAGKIEALLD